MPLLRSFGREAATYVQAPAKSCRGCVTTAFELPATPQGAAFLLPKAGKGKDMSDLTPQEREQIYQEEKARRERAQQVTAASPAAPKKNDIGCISFLVVPWMIILGILHWQLLVSLLIAVLIYKRLKASKKEAIIYGFVLLVCLEIGTFLITPKTAPNASKSDFFSQLLSEEDAAPTEQQAKAEQEKQQQEKIAEEERDRERNWIALGQELVTAKLKDPGSAEFKNLFFHRGMGNTPVTCGEVNSKNGFGGYSGYQHFISAGSSELTYLEEEVSDFAALWNKLCVSDPPKNKSKH